MIILITGAAALLEWALRAWARARAAAEVAELEHLLTLEAPSDCGCR